MIALKRQVFALLAAGVVAVATVAEACTRAVYLGPEDCILSS